MSLITLKHLNDYSKMTSMMTIITDKTKLEYLTISFLMLVNSSLFRHKITMKVLLLFTAVVICALEALAGGYLSYTTCHQFEIF